MKKARASARSTEPVWRTTNARMAAAAATKASGTKMESGMRGDQSRLMSLPQPFEQGGNVHLVGLVVAGQRVHDDVDAARGRPFRAGADVPGVSG